MSNIFEEAIKGGKPPPSAVGMTSPHDIGSSGEYFLKERKGLIPSIISSYIKDDDTSAAIASFYMKCKKFKMADMDDEPMSWLLTVLACWRGINGAALVLAFQTAVGAISEITTTSALNLPGARDLAKKVKDRRDKDQQKMERGKVQD